jgi:hypothetical protein
VNSNAIPLKAAVVSHAVYKMRHVLVAVEPSFQAHDVWTMSAARREYEWEIKQHMGDLRREKDKPKHRFLLTPSPWEGYPNYFYIVVPESIEVDAKKWLAKYMPYAGFAVSRTHLQILEIMQKAPLLHSHRASLKRCSIVAHWMSVTLADLMKSRANIEDAVKP